MFAVFFVKFLEMSFFIRIFGEVKPLKQIYIMRTFLQFTVLSAVLLMLAGGLVSCSACGNIDPARDNPLFCHNELYSINVDFDNGIDRVTVKVKDLSDFDHIVEVELMVFDGSIYRSVEVARGDWINDGFTITLPETLDSNFLRPLLNHSGLLPSIHPEIPPTMSISNENVRVGIVSFRAIGNTASFSPLFCKIGEDGIAHNVHLIYVDSDVTISGYRKTSMAQDEACECGRKIMWMLWDVTINYSIEWRRGWNVWYFSAFRSGAERKITEHWSTTLSAN